MKIIHCADIHLDSKMEGLSAEKAKVRREELFDAFERIAKFADKNGVRAVIIAGDLFDSERIFIKSKKRIFHTVSKYENVDFIYLQGNHEKSSLLDDEKDIPKNFKSFNSNWTEFCYDNVVISGSTADINSSILTKSFDKDKINIVVAHGEIVNHLSTRADGVVSLPLFKDKNINYLALGHYHKFMDGVIDNRGKFVYSGCPEGRGFDETGEKGVVLIETNNCVLDYKFIPLSKRSVVEVVIDVSGYNSWLLLRDYAVSEIAQNAKNLDLVKVTFVGGRSGYELDVSGLENILVDKCFYIKVVDKTKSELKIDNFEFDKSVLGEFVSIVLKTDFENQTKNSIIMCGIKALKGEEL